MLIDVTTASGFECKVDDELFDDYRMLKAVRKTNSDDADEVLDGTMWIVENVFGEYEEKLCEHIAKKYGRVPIGVLGEDIASVMNSIGKAKN